FVFYVDDVTGVERIATVCFESFEYSDHDILESWMRGIRDNGVARVEGNAAERFELVRDAAEDLRLGDVAQIEDNHSESTHPAITDRAAVLDTPRNGGAAVIARPRGLIAGKWPFFVFV